MKRFLILNILSILLAVPVFNAASAAPEISLQQIKTGFTGEFCYVHARAGMMPDGTAVITAQPLYLKGMDVFYGLEMLKSSDGGRSWSDFQKSVTMTRQKYDAEREYVICDSSPFYHKKSGKLLITGQSAVYAGGRLAPPPRPRHTMWSIFDLKTGDWGAARELKMPDETQFFSCGAGSAQIAELPDGDLLIPVYGASAKELSVKPLRYKSRVLKCSFDGSMIKVKTIGAPLTTDAPRGLYEPSVIEFKGKYFLSLRNDKAGYVCRSDDGLDYTKPQVLRFDDGVISGNYNTQTHWVKGGSKLYLVYTRKGAGNDHVFRHRAPLFIAEIDPEKLCLIRSTGMIAVPERGARLGNFGCVQISDNEAWIVAAEWMQTTAPDSSDYTKCMKYGSDNSIWIAKIKFRTE